MRGGLEGSRLNLAHSGRSYESHYRKWLAPAFSFAWAEELDRCARPSGHDALRGRQRYAWVSPIDEVRGNPAGAAG